MIALARLGVALGLNLNWVFDPVTAYRRGERVRMGQSEPFHMG